VKFYFNECFPPSTRNRAFINDVLSALASQGPVVSLTTELNIDDHQADTADDTGVQHLPDNIDPAHNLHIQSAIVAGARAFVGTYGGFAYLAPFYGVPSIAYFDDPNGFSRRHLAMARSAFNAIGPDDLLRVSDVTEGRTPLSTLEERRV
jgi:hypothetical protein